MSAHTLVLGAGAAGSVIANRITENVDLSVELIEAGPDYPPGSRYPADLANGRRNAMISHDWGYHHRPTPRGALFTMPRGKVVGGSSAVNTCIALRNEPEDFEEWAALGVEGWSFEECLPYYRKLETDLDYPDSEWHGDSGPLPVRRHPPAELRTWQRAFVDASRRIGFPDCPDTNIPGGFGVSPHAMNKLDGRRISAAEAWLTPEVRDRENLTITANTMVHRVVVREGRVRGVEVDQGGQREVIHCERVVLCAGALGTPGILLRSGIGPRADVERLGVELLVDNPGVGCQICDHPGNALIFRPKRGVPWDREDPIIQVVLRAKLGKGPGPTDVQIQAGGLLPAPWGDVYRGFIIMSSLCKPRAKGTIRFRSADPRQRPIVESHMLTDPDDLELAVRSLQLCLELADTPEMRRLAHCVYPTRYLARSRRFLRWWAPLATDSGYHPCGTVPMGRATDSRGRIDGVDGLVVADASLFPTVPSSNTHLPVLMFAERFGEWLRDDPS